MGSLTVSTKDAAVHEAAIDALAAELHRPIAEIKLRYESEYARLQEGARVTDFLSVFATRRTRDSLRSPHR